jgi:2-methylcitrate dehydratase PrpD
VSSRAPEPAGGSAAAERGVAELLAWAAGLTYDAIPPVARRRMALIIGDDIGAIVSAQGEPEVRQVQERLIASSPSAEATLLRTGGPRVDARSAALGNGLAASWNEMDGGYRKAPCHAGIYSLPALFAVAEKERLTMREVLRAGVAAYEIAARFARTWRSIMPPLHPHAIFNSVGAAAAAGLARGLDAQRLTLAVTGATTMVSPGPWNHAIRGVLVRNAWPAVGAQIGMLAVDLAEAGIGGVASSPYDVYAGCFGAETDAVQLADGLGSDWAVVDGYHKLHACCQYAHSSVDALSEILARRPDLAGGERVAGIEVETHPLGMTLDNYRPATTLASKFSIPHAAAALVVYGNAGVEAFSSAALAEPRVSRLRAKVEMKAHARVREWPLDRPARVTLVLDSGERLSAECESARGGSDRPFAEDEVRAKITRLSASATPGLVGALGALTDSPERPFGEWMASIFRDGRN